MGNASATRGGATHAPISEDIRLDPCCSVRLAPAAKAEAVNADEAHAIGVNAYLYFYSLVTMDLTRKQLINMEPGPGSLGGPDESLCQH